MPKNRNSLLRFQVIDRCLRNRGRKYTWKAILKEVNEALIESSPDSNGIGKTTLYKDLNDIQFNIYKLEIERITVGKIVYLRYANPNDSINNHFLNQTELKKLKDATSVLSRFKGVDQFSWINEIIPIIESKMGLLNKEREKEVISFENNSEYSGAKFLSDLINAILNKRVLNLKYQGFRSNHPSEIEIHPQYLKQFNSRWFIMSLMDIWGKKPQIHALDRIKSILEVETDYKELYDFDWSDYFEDIIGVTHIDADPITIEILIRDKEQADYIETKPLHHSQKPIRKVEDGYKTNITVIPNIELEKLILSFGERISVLAPLNFKNKIKQRITLMYEHYLTS